MVVVWGDPILKEFNEDIRNYLSVVEMDGKATLLEALTTIS